MIKKASLVVILLLMATSAFAAQPNVEAMYQDARRQFYALLGSEKKMSDRSQWRRVINKFRKIAKTRPKSSRGRDSVYTMGLLYERLYIRSGKNSDSKEAVKFYTDVIKRFPKSSLATHSKRHIGDIRFRSRDVPSAAKAYRSALKKNKARQQKGRAAKPNHLAKLTSVKRFSRDGYTRLILYLSNRTAYKAVRIKKPGRVFIDLLDTGVKASFPKITKYGSGMARSLRVARNRSNVTRVVVDLSEENSTHNVTALNNPFRIIIDLGRIMPVAKIKKPAKKKTKRKIKIAKVIAPEIRPSGRIRMIVIDPGHGGKDPGAKGATGLKEKDVTLVIAKKLKRALEKKMKCRVALTRTTDRFMELGERTVIANSLNADLFISIHANAHKNRKARGVETYFLSPARSKDELETAARENMLALHSKNEVENDLAYIMSDLSNTRKINDSAQLASSVQRSTIKRLRRSYMGISDKGVRQAMFHVLWRASMPSILIETGFITNKKEEGRLRSHAYLNKLADSIAHGIYQYSKTYMVAENK